MRFENLSNERIGIINKNRQGSSMIVEKYNRNDDIVVKFLEHGNLVNTDWRNFKEGNIKNVYDRMVHGIGYLGEGKYKSRENGKITNQYNTWHSMFNRCYNEKNHLKFPSYKGGSVTIEWHNFQNFAKWYDENYYSIEGEMMCLDKDILVKGNKVYSPETCVFVPRRINTLFAKGHKNRGNLPIGVVLNKSTKKATFEAFCYNIEGNTKKSFNTPEKAFQTYKMFKEKLIKQVAEEYKDKIPVHLYNAMIKYRVEIDD
jgi:hypothetical protein